MASRRQRVAVVRRDARDHLPLVRTARFDLDLAGELHRRLDRLRAAAEKVSEVEVARRESDELRSQSFAGAMGELGAVDVAEAARSGLVVSEQAPESHPLKGRFLSRNRIYNKYIYTTKCNTWYDLLQGSCECNW